MFLLNIPVRQPGGAHLGLGAGGDLAVAEPTPPASRLLLPPVGQDLSRLFSLLIAESHTWSS